MFILLPSINLQIKEKNGFLFKRILRNETITGACTSHKKGNINFYIIKDANRECLLTFDHGIKSILEQYRFALKISENIKIDNDTELDLSKCEWLKHPLLDQVVKKQFIKSAVLESWSNTFVIPYKDEENSEGLRIPQIGALHAIQAHWTISKEAGIIVLPTGTGKTDVMIACMVMNKIKSLLVIVPTDALRDQLTRKFLTLGILPSIGLINRDFESPIVGQIIHKFDTTQEVEQFFGAVNVVIATMSVMVACDPLIQSCIAVNCSHLFIDEAHHTPAETWRLFRVLFEESKSLLFTATPFRNDGKRLEGKIIFNFPLKRAQELGYFRPIHFKPVSEYDYHIADQTIAETAIDQLKADLSLGYDHILMVRVNKIERGLEILPLYQVHSEYAPILVHSQIKPNSLLKQIIRQIIERKHRVIICVDMLGEGFDLPELKIAAFHDTKKSLTITLQLAGRFTRVKSNLGPATFIANIADPEVNEDLEDLYYRDSDWNLLLPDLSYRMSLEQEDFRTFLEGFKGFPDKFPIHVIKHPLSALIFQVPESEWKPSRYQNGIRGIGSFEYKYSDYNKDLEILIVILGKRSSVKWARVQDFESVEWDIIICHFDRSTKLLYLHASNTNSYYAPFVQSICKNAVLIKGQAVFRCFHNVNRIRLHNVGVREPLGRSINFIMRVGSDIKTALRDTEIKKAIKSNVFGVGFENGSRTSIGCSHNGRIWSMRTNDVRTWMKWCKSVALKVIDNNIDPDQVLKGTLIPHEVDKIPDIKVFAIEWPDIIFRDGIGNFELVYNNEVCPIWNCEIVIGSQSNSSVTFKVQLPSSTHILTLHIFSNDDTKQYEILSNSSICIKDGINSELLKDYLLDHPPLMYFVNGAFLEGNLFTQVHSVVPEFSYDHFEIFEWEGVNIRKESQTYEKFTDSIQYYIIQKLIQKNLYSLLMDDDDKGEIADVIGFKVIEDQRILQMDLYHCKYSSELRPGLRLEDIYEVCGQAQKSIKWMEDIEEIFKHLGRRNSDRIRKKGVTRFEIGDQNVLEILKRRAKRELKVTINVFIVQPGLSFSNYDLKSDISKLLAVVQTYLIETWNAKLKVIVSE